MQEIHREICDVDSSFSGLFVISLPSDQHGFCWRDGGPRWGGTRDMRDEMRTDFCHRNPVLSRLN